MGPRASQRVQHPRHLSLLWRARAALLSGRSLLRRSGNRVAPWPGGRGRGRDTVVTPGIDPYAITVGATDDRGSVDRDDDVFAWFSAWGSASSSKPKPDLVAPVGVSSRCACPAAGST